MNEQSPYLLTRGVVEILDVDAHAASVEDWKGNRPLLLFLSLLPSSTSLPHLVPNSTTRPRNIREYTNCS